MAVECAICRHYRYMPDAYGDAPEHQCRRYPPVVVASDDEGWVGMFPPALGICGEYEGVMPAQGEAK